MVRGRNAEVRRTFDSPLSARRGVHHGRLIISGSGVGEPPRGRPPTLTITTTISLDSGPAAQ